MTQAVAAMEGENRTHRKPAPEALKYGRPPRPCCPVHGIEMKVGSSPPGWRYYYCRFPDCGQSATERR